MKKFEEGIFSDLRNLKPGVDASLEEPKVGFRTTVAGIASRFDEEFRRISSFSYESEEG
jgi:hypothetical protein